MSKYYVFRKSEYTGRVEVKRAKCADIWCSAEFMKQRPDRVWKFSESGAKGIVEREKKNGWHFTYWIEKAD